MTKYCPKCKERLMTGQLVELTIIAPYRELASNVTFSVGKPVDSYPESLCHSECEDLNVKA